MKFLLSLFLVMSPMTCDVQSLFLKSNIPSSSGYVDVDLDGNVDCVVLGPKHPIVLQFRESIDTDSFDLDDDIVPMPFLRLSAEFTSTVHENDTLVLTPIASNLTIAHNIILREFSIFPKNPNSPYMLSEEVSLFFRVREIADNINPYITKLLPENGAVGVSCHTPLKVIFSEKMMSVNVFLSENFPPTFIIDSQYNPSYGMRFTEDLKENTTYTITFESISTKDRIGTIDMHGNNIVDIAGSRLPRQVEWIFTTGNCE